MSLLLGDLAVQRNWTFKTKKNIHENPHRNRCAYVRTCWLAAVCLRRSRRLPPYSRKIIGFEVARFKLAPLI